MKERSEGMRETLPVSTGSEERLAREVDRLRQALAREQQGARQLREALELAAAYFHAPLGDPGDDVAWKRIITAIRSDAGRAPEGEEAHDGVPLTPPAGTRGEA